MSDLATELSKALGVYHDVVAGNNMTAGMMGGWYDVYDWGHWWCD